MSKKHNKHTSEFKADALKLAEHVGVAKVAAVELGVYTSQIHTWHNVLNNRQTISEKESSQVVEIARLKRQRTEPEELDILNIHTLRAWLFSRAIFIGIKTGGLGLACGEPMTVRNLEELLDFICSRFDLLRPTFYQPSGSTGRHSKSRTGKPPRFLPGQSNPVPSPLGSPGIMGRCKNVGAAGANNRRVYGVLI